MVVTTDAGRRQLIASTPIGEDRFEIVLDAPTDELTARVRTLLLPLFESLTLTPRDL